MPRRAPSPTPSENEIDILGSLYTDDLDTSHGKKSGNGALNDQDLDFGGLLDAAENGASGDDDEDEAFIALKQAASFRKASNLKGRTVKKGGGFQAMGMRSHH